MPLHLHFVFLLIVSLALACSDSASTQTASDQDDLDEAALFVQMEQWMSQEATIDPETEVLLMPGFNGGEPLVMSTLPPEEQFPCPTDCCATIAKQVTESIEYAQSGGAAEYYNRIGAIVEGLYQQGESAHTFTDATNQELRNLWEEALARPMKDPEEIDWTGSFFYATVWMGRVIRSMDHQSAIADHFVILCRHAEEQNRQGELEDFAHIPSSLYSLIPKD